MFDTIAGLPIHPLLVHATVVLLPAAALAVTVAALWPRFRARAGVVPLVLAVAALVLVPVSAQSGRSLADRVGRTALVATHEGRGDDLLPWAIALAVAAVAVHLLRRAEAGPRATARPPRRAVPILVAVLALVAATGTTVQVGRVAHSGAEAVWSDVGGTPN